MALSLAPWGLWCRFRYRHFQNMFAKLMAHKTAAMSENRQSTDGSKRFSLFGLSWPGWRVVELRAGPGRRALRVAPISPSFRGVWGFGRVRMRSVARCWRKGFTDQRILSTAPVELVLACLSVAMNSMRRKRPSQEFHGQTSLGLIDKVPGFVGGLSTQ